ncbi:MAG: HNH endonuclease signature motif containing protein [Ferruginibacter sp.]
MAKKSRVAIPDDIAAEILFISDRTCCVCNVRGKNVQLHHIDENPANNVLENLCSLCFDCHNETQIKGGFGRKLEANQIIKYRTAWIERVKTRKAKADELASIQTVTGSTENMIVTSTPSEDHLNYKTGDQLELLKDYLDKILIIHQAQLTIAQVHWDSGINSEMNQSSYDMIDFYEEVLIELSTFYPKGHFNNQSPKNYFSELIASRFFWHRLIAEPGGVGTGGTIISTMTEQT